MKGILFTTDAIFSLLIVAFAITILSYFVFTPASSQNISSSRAHFVLSLFTSTNIKTLSTQSTFNNQIFSGVKQSDWTQVGTNSKRTYTNPSGPLYPFLLYNYYVPNGITTNLVSAYGTIYFGSKTQIFAINSSTGKTIWSRVPFKTSITSMYPNSLAIYSGELIYTNGTEVHALSLDNSSFFWNFTLLNGYTITSSPLVYNNNIYFGASNTADTQIYSLNTFNGTLSQNVITQFPILYLGQLNGSIIATDLNGNMISMNTNGSIMSRVAPSGPTYPFTTQGQFINFENGTQFCKANASFDESCTAHGLSAIFAISNNQYSNIRILNTELFDIKSPGVSYWSYTNSNLGSTIGNPIISNNTIYSMWNDGFVLANNLSNGKLEFMTLTPSKTITSMILSGGILSVASANHIYSYGRCFSNTNSTLTYALTYLYSKGYGSCATYLSYSEYPSDTYGIQVNGVYGPSNTLLQYTGNSYTELNYTLKNGYNLYLGSGGSGLSLGSTFNTDTWYLIGVVNNATAGTVTTYVNGRLINTQTSTISNSYSLSEWIYPENTASFNYINGVIASTSTTNSLLVGCSSLSCTDGFNGIITNLQIYSGALTQNNVSSMYSEGIANYPVSNMDLVAWLPLEGDTNDYSGFGNTGYNSNVLYTSLQYTPPIVSSSQLVSQASMLSPVTNTQSITEGPISSNQGGKLYKFGVYTWK